MIHPSSIISSKAEIDSSVNIGPFCIIDDNVKLGRDVYETSKTEKSSMKTKYGSN